MARTVTEVDADLKALTRTVVELEKDAAVRQRQADALEKGLERTTNEFNDHRRQSDQRAALLEREVADLKADRDRWAARFWYVVTGVLVAVLGGVSVAAIVAMIGLRKP